MSKVFQSEYIPYSQTGKFTKIILDYVAGVKDLKDFYEHEVSVDGIKASIGQRKKFNTNRTLLVEQLKAQYKNADGNNIVHENINALLNENTFAVCTAHQPNIFTGHLYFIYKILHAIKIADDLKKQMPQYNFVPVFFMGSEDADLEELNHIIVDGRKYVWDTKQTGAVGRMKVDDNLLKLISEIEGRLLVEKNGKEIIELLKKCFQKNSTIEQSTFLFVHNLFKQYGLIVFLPDNASLKKEMLPIFEEDIFENTPSKIVNKSSKKLSEKYKVQAHPREINLFYLQENIRNRIIYHKDDFVVNNTDIVFTKDGIKSELHQHPENFSPNVILRGLYQEMILPNIAFIGGGGEIAYWLELKDLFKHYKTPFPVLIVRNSFLIIESRIQKLIQKLKLNSKDLFNTNQALLNKIVSDKSSHTLSLDAKKTELEQVYNDIKKLAGEIDVTLRSHAEALETKSLKKISALEKKMLRAEKRKFEDEKKQLEKIFSILFPGDNLQERTENFMLFYSKWGNEFFEMLYKNSLTFEQEFCAVEERK
jgi:bacillithiol biosynthesis cysteine-adding enzyme BshC